MLTTNRPPSGENSPHAVPEWFPRCLTARREAKNLSKVELADLAGVDEKTVRNIELGHQSNPLPSTRLLLAKALNCTLEELHSNCLKKETWRDRNQKWLLTSSAVFAFIFISVAAIALTNTNWSKTPACITVTDGVFNATLWQYKSEAEITACLVAPWSKNVLLLAFGKDAPGGGHIMALNRITGQEIWTASLDVEQVRNIFGAKVVDAANFTAVSIHPWDRDGDGTPEIAVRFCHGKWYPNAIISIDSNGIVQAQYNFNGHISQIVVWDLDHDGRDELIVAGTNNASAYQGGTLTILNQDHFKGASVDSFGMANPKVSDGSLARVVFPAYPAAHMKQMSDIRLLAAEVQVIEKHGGETMISATIGYHLEERIVVFMDAGLHPIRSDMVDTFFQTLKSWPDSLINNSGPGDDQWRAEWLATNHHFGGWE